EQGVLFEPHQVAVHSHGGRSARRQVEVASVQLEESVQEILDRHGKGTAGLRLWGRRAERRNCFNTHVSPPLWVAREFDVPLYIGRIGGHPYPRLSLRWGRTGLGAATRLRSC